MNGVKILLLTHFFKPETGAAVTRINYFYEILKQYFKEVKVVTPKPNYPQGRIYKNYKDILPEDYKDNVKYLPIYLPKFQHSVFRMFSYVSYFFNSILYSLIYIRKTDVVITSSPPIITALAAFIVSKLKKSVFILDIRDVWPDIGIELGIIKNPLSVKGLRWIERLILNNADKIIVTAEGDRRNIINKNIDPHKITVIYNGADSEIFYPKDENEIERIRKNYKIPLNKAILIYFGSFNYGMNDIELLADALINISKKGKEFFFVAIETGTNAPKLFDKIDGLVEYKHFSSLTNSEVAEILSSSNISLIPRKKITKDTGGNIPVKCYESWAAGIPVVMSSLENSEVTEIFNLCNAGKLTNTGDPGAFVNAVAKLLERDDLRELGIKGRKLVEEKFDRYNQSKKIVEIINQCLP